ncbi:hypothetical protein [Streptomyces sp. NPDC004042]
MTHEQRERWWAAAFSELGADYEFKPLGVYGAGPVRQGAAA